MGSRKLGILIWVSLFFGIGMMHSAETKIQKIEKLYPRLAKSAPKIDGELNDTKVVYPHDTLLLRDTSNDFTIGRFLKEAGYPGFFGYCYFKGSIDEVRISSVDRSKDWIRLSYINQKSDGKLVQFK